MALRLGKRKRPSREDKPLKEVSLIAGRALDDSTLMVLVKLINTKVIKSLDYPLAHGKEAAVFRATRPDGSHAAVKIYKYETTSFHTMSRYIEGDPRFAKAKHSLRPLIRQWAKKEFANLELCQEAKVHAPVPIAQRDNVVVMEFLGEGGIPYAKLQDVVLEDPEKTLDAILLDVRKLYGAGMVHADLSPFNIIIVGDTPYLIDVSQSVLLAHPRADLFLQNDVKVMLNFFDKLGVHRDLQDTLKWVREG